MKTTIVGTFKTQIVGQCIPISYGSLILPARALIASMISILLSKTHPPHTPTPTLYHVSFTHVAHSRTATYSEVARAGISTPPRTRDGTMATRSNLSDYRNITTANGMAL
jgi:hypothetical protein